jgi:hypothetical protein
MRGEGLDGFLKKGQMCMAIQYWPEWKWHECWVGRESDCTGGLGKKVLYYRTGPTQCCTVISRLKGTVSRGYCLGFFHESSSPKLLKRTLGSFQICLIIRGDIHKSRFTTGVKYTGGKFATGIKDTGGKFCHHCCWCC